MTAQSSHRLISSRVCTILLAFCGIFHAATAQTNGFASYLTGANLVRMTDTRVFTLPASTSGGAFYFQFGFSTDETPGGGVFHDSWTATLQTADGKSTAVYFSVDAAGVQWAPPTPGGVVVDPNSIARQAIPFPSLQPVFAHQWSYEVTVPIPQKFFGQQVNVFLDLFDNGDAIRSLGWINTVTVVPEPRIMALGVLGCIAWMAGRRSK